MSGRPTHLHKSTGAAVFPQGYAADDLELLPDGYWDAVDREARITAIKAEAAAIILAEYPLWKQMNAAFEPDADWVKAMRARINEIRRKSNEQEAAIQTERE